MVHLAIMDKRTIKMILDGEKTIESRFSKNRITPFNKVSVGEIVYLKESSKDVVASFEIEKVLLYDNLTPQKVDQIYKEYNKMIKAPSIYWSTKSNSKYGTLMYIKNVKNINPFKVSKKGRQGFVSYTRLEIE